MLRKILESLLVHPLARDSDLNSPETTDCRLRIIQQKPFLKQFYQDCYISIAKHLPKEIGGSVLELGSGGGFLGSYIHEVITSEIINVSNVDVILDGQILPIKNDALKAIVMVDVLHHISDVRSFFTDAARSVKTGGAIIMIEPWVSGWSKIVYGRLHHEPFDAETKDWKLPKGGPLSTANSALPWIVFKRDREIFIHDFKEWDIKEIRPQSPFCYLLSGGVSFRTFAPGFSYPYCRKIERAVQPWIRHLALFALIVLEKKQIG